MGDGPAGTAALHGAENPGGSGGGGRRSRQTWLQWQQPHGGILQLLLRGLNHCSLRWELIQDEGGDAGLLAVRCVCAVRPAQGAAELLYRIERYHAR